MMVKAVEMDCTFNKDVFGNTATIYRDLAKGVKGGQFSFKLYNPNNSNEQGEARFKASVIAYDKNGNKIDLGDCTPGELGYLKFSGSLGTAYQYNGFSTCTVNLPSDKVIVRLEVVITETTNKEVSGALLFFDDVKFISTTQVELDSASSNPSTTSNTTSSGNTVSDNNNIPTGENTGLLVISLLVALVSVGCIVTLRCKKKPVTTR